MGLRDSDLPAREKGRGARLHADALLMALKHGACFGELLKDAPLILLDRPDRAVSTGPTQFLHDLRRRAGQRAERAQQARVFVSPFFVFGWKHPGNPKRVGNGPTVRRERIDHSKPLQNIARTEFPSGHFARPARQR